MLFENKRKIQNYYCFIVNSKFLYFIGDISLSFYRGFQNYYCFIVYLKFLYFIGKNPNNSLSRIPIKKVRNQKGSSRSLLEWTLFLPCMEEKGMELDRWK